MLYYRKISERVYIAYKKYKFIWFIEFIKTDNINHYNFNKKIKYTPLTQPPQDLIPQLEKIESDLIYRLRI